VFEPSVVLLAAIVALVAHPWLGVRRVACEILGVTDQVVIVALAGRRARGDFVRVSREGREWHAFAVATSGREGPAGSAWSSAAREIGPNGWQGTSNAGAGRPTCSSGAPSRPPT
jgi:hypothetical protein